MEGIALHLALSIFFTICSAFFSGAETALFSLSRARLLEYSGQSSLARRRIADLMDDYQHTLTAIVLGNMFMNASLSISLNEIISRFESSSGITLAASLFITLVILLVGGEVTPKAVAILNAERIADLVAVPLWHYRRAVMPFVLFLEKTHSVLWRIVGRNRQQPLDYDEYYAFVEMAEKIGAFTPTEALTLERVLDFDATPVARLVTARLDFQCLLEHMSAADVERVIRNSRKKYLPVGKTSIDDADAILSARRFMSLDPSQKASWRKSGCCFEAVFIPENSTLRTVLPTFIRKKLPAALVVDEFGGVTGLICKKDIYTRIFGCIREEFDRVELKARRSGRTDWLIDGDLSLDELLTLIPTLRLPELDAGSLAGIVAQSLKKIPSSGDSVELENCAITVLEADAGRIRRMRLSLSTNDEKKGDDDK